MGAGACGSGSSVGGDSFLALVRRGVGAGLALRMAWERRRRSLGSAVAARVDSSASRAALARARWRRSSARWVRCW